jgi:hypothetical protein
MGSKSSRFGFVRNNGFLSRTSSQPFGKRGRKFAIEHLELRNMFAGMSHDSVEAVAEFVSSDVEVAEVVKVAPTDEIVEFFDADLTFVPDESVSDEQDYETRVLPWFEPEIYSTLILPEGDSEVIAGDPKYLGDVWNEPLMQVETTFEDLYRNLDDGMVIYDESGEIAGEEEMPLFDYRYNLDGEEEVVVTTGDDVIDDLERTDDFDPEIVYFGGVVDDEIYSTGAPTGDATSALVVDYGRYFEESNGSLGLPAVQTANQETVESISVFEHQLASTDFSDAGNHSLIEGIYAVRKQVAGKDKAGHLFADTDTATEQAVINSLVEILNQSMLRL